jgi:acid phosphatase
MRVPEESSTVAEAPSLPDQPHFILADSQMRFVALGDVGYANEELRTTAEMLRKKMSQVSAAFLLGDNFYPRGISKEAGLADPQFSGVFENILAPSLDAPFYVVLGNHDFMGDAEAQVEYSRHNPKWILPGFYHFKRFQASDFATCVWFLDTEHFSQRNGQDEWLIASLTSEGPSCKWKIVIGHHPIFDVGEYDDDAELIASLLPILNSFNVNLYISGHEHQSQVMYNPIVSPVTFIVSGITQEIRSKIQKPDHPLFVWSDPKKLAFLELVITSENLVYSFHRSAGGRAAPPLYTGTLSAN